MLSSSNTNTNTCSYSRTWFALPIGQSTILLPSLPLPLPLLVFPLFIHIFTQFRTSDIYLSMAMPPPCINFSIHFELWITNLPTKKNKHTYSHTSNNHKPNTHWTFFFATLWEQKKNCRQLSQWNSGLKASGKCTFDIRWKKNIKYKQNNIRT